MQNEEVDLNLLLGKIAELSVIYCRIKTQRADAEEPQVNIEHVWRFAHKKYQMYTWQSIIYI